MLKSLQKQKNLYKHIRIILELNFTICSDSDQTRLGSKNAQGHGGLLEDLGAHLLEDEGITFLHTSIYI